MQASLRGSVFRTNGSAVTICRTIEGLNRKMIHGRAIQEIEKVYAGEVVLSAYEHTRCDPYIVLTIVGDIINIAHVIDASVKTLGQLSLQCLGAYDFLDYLQTENLRLTRLVEQNQSIGEENEQLGASVKELVKVVDDRNKKIILLKNRNYKMSKEEEDLRGKLSSYTDRITETKRILAVLEREFNQYILSWGLSTPGNIQEQINKLKSI